MGNACAHNFVDTTTGLCSHCGIPLPDDSPKLSDSEVDDILIEHGLCGTTGQVAAIRAAFAQGAAALASTPPTPDANRERDRFLAEREAHVRFYLNRDDELSVEASIDHRIVLGADLDDLVTHLRATEACSETAAPAAETMNTTKRG